MTPRKRLSLIVVGAAIAVLVTACATGFMGFNSSHNAKFTGHTVVLPATAVSAADHEAMNKILQKYDKRIYKLQTYENGRLTQTTGKLRDVLIDKAMASEAALAASKPGFTHDVIQLGVGEMGLPLRGNGVNPQVQGTPAPGNGVNPQVQGTPTPGNGVNPQVQGTPMPGNGVNPQVQGTPMPGNGSSPQQLSVIPGTGTNPQVPPVQFKASAALVRELEPILRKYGRR